MNFALLIGFERNIKEIQRGIRYDGHLKLLQKIFEFELFFKVPVPKFEQLKSIPHPDKVVAITILENGARIPLTEAERILFFRLLVYPVAIFYFNMGKQEGPGEMERTSKILKAPKTIQILNAPKFDCCITTDSKKN